MKKNIIIVVFLLVSVVSKSQNITDTLSYLNDSIVAKSNLYIGQKCSKLFNALKLNIKSNEAPIYFAMGYDDSLTLIKLRVYFTTNWLDKKATVLYNKRNTPNYQTPANLHIKYLDITFTKPVVTKRVLLYGNDKLTSTNWTTYKKNFYGKQIIAKIEAGEY